MNTNTTLERIAAANTVPSADALPAEPWSADDLLARIDERSTPVTDLKPIQSPRPEDERSRWRGPAIAGAVAATILLLFGIVALVATDTEGEFASQPAPDALSVVNEFYLRYDNADATLSDLVSPAFYAEFPEARTSLELESRYASVTGMAVDRSCTAVATTEVVCERVMVSGLNPNTTYRPSPITYMVDQGLITHMYTDGPWQGDIELDRAEAQAYALWVRDNHPDKYDDLIVAGQTLVMHNAEWQRLQGQMIAQYHEALGI